MAITIANSFTEQWGTEVKHQYNVTALVTPHVNILKIDGANSFKFPTLSRGTGGYQKTRNADLTIQEPGHDKVTVTTTDFYSSTLFDDLDQFKSNISYRNHYLKWVTNNIAFDRDKALLTALGLTGNSSTATAGQLTVARLLDVKKILDNKRVPQSDRKFIIGATALSQMLAQTQITSVDYAAVRALVDGSVKTFLGFEFITVPDDFLATITGTPNKYRCFAFHKDALGVLEGQAPKAMVDWSADKHAYWVKCTSAMGAAIIDADGVLRIDVDIA